MFLDFSLLGDELIHLIGGHGVGKFFIDLVECIHQIYGFLYRFFDAFSDRFRIIQTGLLLKIADSVPRGKNQLTIKFRVDTCQNS